MNEYRYFMMAIAGIVAWPAMAQPLAEYTLKLTPAQLDTIGEGLGFMPFNKAAPLINTLREQVMAQQPKPEVPKPPIATCDGDQCKLEAPKVK